MSNLQELEEYRKYTSPAELHKAINTLKGIVAGITTDYKISEDEVNELSHWCLCHAHLIDRHPFKELIPLIESAYKDSVLTADESSDIVWLCNNFVSDSDYYNLVTSSLQFLNGMIHGILADGVITDEEIRTLNTWISSNDYLTGCYPFDEIESLLLSILNDGIVTEDERNMLKAFLSNFIDLKSSYNLNSKEIETLREHYSISGICAICQEIEFDGNQFCFTGQSLRAKRKEIADLITSLGGKFNNSITNKTRYLIVGNDGNPCWAFSCYGRKIEDAVNRRKAGQTLTIVNEVDFWDAVDDLV
ncbi:NAD-dependent DNA ligase [Eubacterium sp. am_0171]|uniref:DNA polymerase III subunit epsilon n=1 Tax=Faecalicatena contorta TaxID=39482 RepID=A0A174CGP8_9FIRM|nr:MULTISPECIES: BRCT domain-containing protein [Clostridia]MSC85913.1 NAD-dependent DNA ligase [Eubacterium sp. BIOML-A1]MSD08286.1 NAD-dependent DNA ligase [Eubacterium sp. BIOML-A2]RYT12646.1 NAD-dependent DNA ligase [Eubacterium sp. am_0171]CUO12522.1 DNA polymerase III subunit epsilon [[Eubacterium] contortum] [Faecalicatena contorta]